MTLKSILLQSAIISERHNDDWKCARVMNELDISIRKLVTSLENRGVPDADMIEEWIEYCMYDNVLLWVMEHSNKDETKLLNHSWMLLCHYQTLRLGPKEKDRWLWTMAEQIHNKNKLKNDTPLLIF
jgi:hypothetical protein